MATASSANRYKTPSNPNQMNDIEDETNVPKMELTKSAGDYCFKFQFFIHECNLLKDFFNIMKPAIAIRFLDFPTLIIDGQLQTSSGFLKFGQGKKCNFKMHSEELEQALLNKPFFVMFIDASSNKYVLFELNFIIAYKYLLAAL